MALNVVTFRTRAVTALVFVANYAGGFIMEPMELSHFIFGYNFGCWMEYQKLVGLIDPEYTKSPPFINMGSCLRVGALCLFHQ